MNLQIDNSRALTEVSVGQEATVLPETAHRFGDGLVGVVTHPPEGARSKVAVLLLNAGLTRHPGPFRLHVDLARTLAARGFPVLRFDQSGVGDSDVPVRSGNDRRQHEVEAAMRLLAEQTGAMRFVLCGLCSGADDAFHVAATNPRVTGAILLDGVAYPTPGFWLRHAVPRLLNFGKVLRYLASRRNPGPSLADFRDWPEKTEARRMLSDIVERGTRLLFVFTGGAYHYFNHRDQLAASLGRAARAPQVALEFWREYDHTFYLRKHRRVLIARVEAWMRSEFGPSESR